MKSGREYELEIARLKSENSKYKKENELKEKENKILKAENKQKDEVIHDLDRNNYKRQCLELKSENEEIKKKLQNALQALEQLKSSLNKNSSNSLKPSSTDSFNHVIQNNRVKTGNKPGRKNGYVSPPPKYIGNPSKVIEVSNNRSCICSCGGHIVNKEIIRRQVIGIEVKPVVEEYRGHIGQCEDCNKEYNPVFPVNVNNPINYDNSIKSLLVYMNTYSNVAERGITNLLSFLTEGKINIAPATVINSAAEFSKKAQVVLGDIKAEMLKSPVINNDETPIKINGKEGSVLGVFTDLLSLLEAHPNRKEEAFIAMNILNIYTGISVHDHNNIHLKFLLSTQAECNFHVLRYAAEQVEIHGFTGIKEWVEVLIGAKEKAEKAKAEGKKRLEEKEIEIIKENYLNALDKWDEEHMKAAARKNKEYFDKSRCLKDRLREYVEDHLRFLSNFAVPFTNNLAERGLRPVKTKEKIANFRSLKGAKNYCDARSIIDTAIKQKVDVGSVITDIFNDITDVFSFQNTDKKEEFEVA